MSTSTILGAAVAAVTLFACGAAPDPTTTTASDPEPVATQEQALTNCSPSGNLAVDGNFESQLAGWTASGSVTATRYAYSGNYAAQVGSAQPYSGDSTISQTIALPSCGRPTLSFRWKGSCTDSVVYDQQQVEVWSTAGAKLLSILNVCQTSDWQPVVQDLSAYRGQTVVLRFNDHDDGYAGDPTYFSVDNVVVNNRVDDYQSYLIGYPQVLNDALSDYYGRKRSPFLPQDYQTLWNAAASLEQYGQLPAIDPAEITVATNCATTDGNPFDCDNYFQARNLAYALWLELNHLVPWSLAEYSNLQLTELLSLLAKPQSAGFAPLLVRPDYARALWNTYAMQGQSLSTRADLEKRLASWIRDHVVHEEAGPNGDGTEALSDISQFLNGTTNCQGQTTKMCVGSCYHNNRFMSAIALAFNVPAVSTVDIGSDSLENHNFIDFPRESVSLIHSDDLYSYNSLQNAPIDPIFLSGNDRTTYLNSAVLQYLTDPATPDPTGADRVHFVHNGWLYFQYPDAALLQHVCSGSTATTTWLQSWWNIPAAVMPDVTAIYTTWQSSLRATAGCP
jgi:hypothetical protein